MTKARVKEREATPDLLGAVAPQPEAKPVVAMEKPARQKKATKTEVVPFQPKERPNLLAAIVAGAADPNCQPEKMHALLDVRGRLMCEQAEVGYRRAYRAAKSQMPKITKDGKLDEGTTRSGRQGKKTMWATYENINKVIGPILDAHGLDLSLHAEPKPGGDGVLMRATLSFVAETEYGEIVYAESSVVPMPPDPTGSKNAAQAVSSALSYAKRNAVVLVLNLISHAPEDRDLDGRRPDKVADAQDEKPKAITKQQLAEITKAIEEAGATIEMVCTKYEVQKLDDLTQPNFDAAMMALRNWAAEKKRQQARNAGR